MGRSMLGYTHDGPPLVRAKCTCQQKARVSFAAHMQEAGSSGIGHRLYLYRLIWVGHSYNRAGSNDLLLAEIAGGSQVGEEQEL